MFDSSKLSIARLASARGSARYSDQLEHLPKERRQFSTWKYVEAELEKAANSHAVARLSTALQMVFQLQHVEYEMTDPANCGANPRRS
jgi:hypothetical protein